MIVIDLGCKTWGNDESLRKLVRRFHPKVVLGFDPHPDTVENVFLVDETVVVVSRRAAWCYAGVISLNTDGLRTHITSDGEGTLVECFDLGSLINLLPRTSKLVVKMDIEGAEYPLLSYLHSRGIDKKIDLLLVEWHLEERANGYGEDGFPELNCKVELW